MLRMEAGKKHLKGSGRQGLMWFVEEELLVPASRQARPGQKTMERQRDLIRARLEPESPTKAI